MKNLLFITFLFLFHISSSSQPILDNDLEKKAEELAQEFIIVDTHIDVPYRLNHHWEDISESAPGGEFDYPRAVKGGLNVPFMSIYIPSRLQGTANAQLLADSLINIVDYFVEKFPGKFAKAYSVNDVFKNFENGIITLAMGMENGAPVTDFDLLKHYYERGIRYITLTHGEWNHIGDSSYDEDRKWHGLSPFGKQLIEEMNKIGVMVDISHVTDETAFDAIETSTAPVIVSHSSCRYFTPGWERNISDDLIKAVAEKGGVIQVNFGSDFLDQNYRDRSQDFEEHVRQFRQEHHLRDSDPELREYKDNYKKEHPIGYADISKVADHIDHIVKLVGIDHVGIGSDFDGVGDSLPIGLKDVSMYPNLIYQLLKRGYSENDIQKICSGNLLRVWKQVEDYASQYK